MSLTSLAYYCFSSLLARFSIIPSSVVKRKEGIWYNTFVSMVNSFIMGVATLYCFYVNPLRLLDLTATETNRFAQTLPLICIGYFVYDIIHCAMHLSSDRAKPIYLHHVLVIVCYSVAMHIDYYNYVTVALLYEINTVFLHARQLCHVAGVSRNNVLYRINKLVNIVSFLLFRIFNFSYIIFFTLFLMETNVALIPYVIGVLAMMVLLACNIYLLAKLIESDYGSHSKRSEMTCNALYQHESHSRTNGNVVRYNGKKS